MYLAMERKPFDSLLRLAPILQEAFDTKENHTGGDDRGQIGNKVTRVLVNEVAFNLRQFQVLKIKCSPVRVMLEDATSIVPLAGEALVAINWDCVYPWLICVTTDDDDDCSPDSATRKDQAQTNDGKRAQCIGVQWDLSVSVIQIAWWDTVTQDIGMLIVLNEFLTHGVLRTDSSSSSLDLELDVYLHLFRGYLLHIEEDFEAAEEIIPDVLPFGSEMVSNFSVETVGTSYRSTHTPEADEDYEALDEEVAATFAPSNSTMFEKMHDDFEEIDYEFAIASLPKVPAKQESTASRLPFSDAESSDRIPEPPRFFSRRGSTRETLLDLLQQGKLDQPSKHIHFEIGTDAGETNTIANLTFDNVTAHVAPIDVDISAGVLWYSQSDVGSPSASGSTLLKQIMDECSLTSAYRHTRSTGATNTEVDLSFLQLSTDRHQFYQLMNVIRHVLLAPPINTLSAPTSTKKLHVLLEEELRNREVRTRGASFRSKATALKAISFKVVGMQWRLRLSPEITGADHEFVGIRIQGFTGCHTYFTNHCTKLTLNLQWLEVSNLHPGPSSAAFEDPTAVLKAKLLVDKRFESSSKLNPGNQKGMLVVRAESGPVVRVHGQKLRVLEVLEVSMFPEVSNMIVIQLAADFYELIYKFFFENVSPAPASSQNSEQVFFGRKSTSEEMSVFEDSDSTADDCELFYVKYVRVGNVRLRINCNGFFVNLSHFDLDLPPYLCQSKLCTSKKLLQKFESHLKWYITKESASSGLSQFKNKLLKWTPSSSSTDGKKDKSKKQEEDTAAANAQVLFGPYSGAST
uniref:Uncharacterized protein n=1 Tax=Phytophthora ramorum TaxID=164328 RepID=H3HC24_PHYRM